jgi:hypothetical protein
MIASETSIPAPASQLARFRLSRLRTGVDMIARQAREFRAQVDAALADPAPDGDRDMPGQPSEKAQKTHKALAGAFSAAYLALSEALEAARSGSVVTGPALEALDGIMSNLKWQYANGIDDLRSDVGRLGGARSAFTEFCALAAEKVDKLEQFWQTTYEHVPQMKMRA